MGLTELAINFLKIQQEKKLFSFKSHRKINKFMLFPETFRYLHTVDIRGPKRLCQLDFKVWPLYKPPIYQGSVANVYYEFKATFKTIRYTVHLVFVVAPVLCVLLKGPQSEKSV